MKIKRLEIAGFKSFADRVVLDFQQGVTGVVGPNGCGKSNVVDAIRWCMGEQSAKNLRGKAMEDIIFAGSEIRKPLGLAEVSLVFSTEDGRAPAKYLEYAEIQLTRRLYRNGDSEYLINKVPCRLMDITELFMDTGVGTRAYSIIEQGKIGMILHSRPEERRFLIEEAAGVTKFKSRKQLALKRIEGTRQNMARLMDVLGEIRRQLVSLQRQAKKAAKFRECRDELREIELLFSASEYRELVAGRSMAEAEQGALNDRIQQISVESAVSETGLENARLQLAEAEQRMSAAQEEIYRVKSEFAVAEGGLDFQRKELTGVSSRLNVLESEAGELAIRMTECMEKQGSLELRRDVSNTDTASLQAELQQAEAAMAAGKQAEAELNTLLEARRKELFTVLAESAQFKNRNENARKRLAALSERLDRHRREGLQLAERMELSCQRAVDIERELEGGVAQQSALQVEMSELRDREGLLKTAIPEQERRWQRCRDELNRSSSRLHSLKELEAQFAGYGQGVKSLMQAGELKSRFSGLLADLLTAPPELEAAVEAALADFLQCVLCDQEADALLAIQYLKDGNRGRAGICLPSVEPIGNVVPIQGTSPLLEQVQLSGAFSGLLNRLLSGVMLADDLEQAIGLARRYPLNSFVTRSGELVSHGGIVSGGSTEQLEKGIIHKKREIRELDARVIQLEQDRGELDQERNQLIRQSQEVAELLKVTAAALHQADIRLAGLRKDQQQVSAEISGIADRLELQNLEIGTLDEERETLEAELRLSGERMIETAEIAGNLEESVAGYRAELDMCRTHLAEAAERTTAIRIQVATLKEQREAHLRSIADLERQAQDLKRRMENGREEMERCVETRARLQEGISSAAERIELLLLQQANADRHLQEIRTAHESAQEALSRCEEDSRGAREQGEAARQALADVSLRLSTLTMQAENIERMLRDKSRIGIAEALLLLDQTEFDPAVRKQRQDELHRLLEEMGEVNLMAIDECVAMEERFNFLSSQRDDLEESLRDLQLAIQRINRTTRQRFLETYNLVNTRFQEVFPRLFCGGRAELRLTDEDDLLETGIDIIVQPPGKKLQNVTLLSGGEKALTAVALIFSIFLIKPTPFCLLDEVDAPLDDANIGRFNDMVREMSAISQFIIITHNKATMQVADTLYGITMESPGISRMVSVRLH